VTRNSTVRRIYFITAFVVMLQLLVLQAMAASGGLHKQLHDHADESDHECAVTLMLHGGYDSELPDLVPVDVLPEPPVVPVRVRITLDLVPSLLDGGVLVEAPPRGP
jgi:hypothetical protein